METLSSDDRSTRKRRRFGAVPFTIASVLFFSLGADAARPRKACPELLLPKSVRALSAAEKATLAGLGYQAADIKRVERFPKLVAEILKRKNYRAEWPTYVPGWDLDEYPLPPKLRRIVRAGSRDVFGEVPLQSTGIVDVDSPRLVEVYRGVAIGTADAPRQKFDPNFNFAQGEVDYVSPDPDFVSEKYMHRKGNNTFVTYVLPAFLVRFEKSYYGDGGVYHHVLDPSHLARYGIDDLTPFVKSVVQDGD